MIQLANHGLEEACKKRPELIGGVNTYAGKCTYEAVSRPTTWITSRCPA